MFYFEIPKYIREVTLSKSQRPIYYKYNGITIKAKNKKLLQKYIKKIYRDYVKSTGIVEPHMLDENYALAFVKNNKVIELYKNINHNNTSFTGKDYKILLIEKETNKLVISNNTKAGKPNIYIINGQDFYSGNLHPFTRRKVMMEIKESFLPYILNAFPVIETLRFPLRIKLIIYDTVKLVTDKTKDPLHISQFWDIGNRAFPYAKAFLDLLATGKTGKMKNNKYISYFDPVIPDDNVLYITEDPSGARFIPIDNPENRKLVFTFHEDTNPKILNNSFYNNYKY